MIHLKRLLKQPLQAVPNKIVIILFALAILGFSDASFLTIEHYQNKIPPCTTSGCETVLTSGYSEIAGIPVALLGAIYYLIIAAGLFAHIEGKHEPSLRAVLLFTAVGFAMSVWFVSAQAFLIHSYCLYCLGSATISTVLFGSSACVLKKYRTS
jgi:uncharacterized membrane protein